MRKHFAFALVIAATAAITGCSSEETTVARTETADPGTGYVAEAPPVPPPLTDTATPTSTDFATATTSPATEATGTDGLPAPMMSAGGTGDAAAGKALFASKCASCHAADGSGSTTMGKNMKIRDLRSADVQSQTDAQLTEIITSGKSPKSAGAHKSKKLSAQDVQNVIAFIRSIKS